MTDFLSEIALEKHYKTFRDFYPYYLSEHTNATCRTLHFIGSSLVLGALVTALITGNAWWFAAMPLAGYGFAWAGHFFFEKNRPATFSYPLYSLVGDWVMYFQLLVGRTKFNARG
ncbi:MAG: DUF962 domain-containing protein [Burkholderiales bacterium]|nr:DUF962 domain-containing protein [Burkholderiales bacterium]